MSERQQPQYGELAPEGWEWKPPSDQPDQDPLGDRAGAAASSHSRPAGVPHNLGSANGGSENSGYGQTNPAPTDYDAPSPSGGSYGSYQPPRPIAQPQGSRIVEVRSDQKPAGERPKRTGDRVVTITLLVFGALGALNMGATMLSMRNTLSMIAEMMGVADATVPPLVDTLATVGAILSLVIYTAVLLWSIARMRARKIAFWVPLLGAVIAGIVSTILMMIAIYQVIPQEVLQDPAQIDILMEKYQEMLTSGTGS